MAQMEDDMTPARKRFVQWNPEEITLAGAYLEAPPGALVVYYEGPPPSARPGAFNAACEVQAANPGAALVSVPSAPAEKANRFFRYCIQKPGEWGKAGA